MSWEWVTEEMYDRALRARVARMSADDILSIGDVYSELRERLNNDVLEDLADEHGRCIHTGDAFPEDEEDDQGDDG